MKFFALILFVLTLIGCEGRNMGTVYLSELNNISREDLDRLSKKKIFFGHQSVGYNIIEGIRDITAKSTNINLNIQETNNPQDFSKPIFAHSRIGRNLDPISKCDDFRRVLEKGLGEKINIAFLKLCYADINERSDLNSVFNYYAETVASLGKEYPNITFVHFTVPLTTAPRGFKSKIKRWMGYSVWTDADNIQRNIFNQMMKDKYNNFVFDLAKYEAISPNGKANFFVFRKKSFYCLANEYASDEGHLNNIGRKYIALKLLKFLSGLY